MKGFGLICLWFLVSILRTSSYALNSLLQGECENNNDDNDDNENNDTITTIPNNNVLKCFFFHASS